MREYIPSCCYCNHSQCLALLQVYFKTTCSPIIEETFCKPAGFPFKQIIPSCSLLRSPMLLPWKFPCVPRLFSSPEECKVFLFKQKFAAWSWANKQQPLAQIPCFFLAHYSRCTFLPEKYFLEKGERLANTKTVGVPAFTKYLQRLKGVLGFLVAGPVSCKASDFCPAL